MGSIISLYGEDNVQQFSTLASEVSTRNPKLFCREFFTDIYLIFLSFKLGEFYSKKASFVGKFRKWKVFKHLNGVIKLSNLLHWPTANHLSVCLSAGSLKDRYFKPFLRDPRMIHLLILLKAITEDYDSHLILRCFHASYKERVYGEDFIMPVVLVT